MTGAYAMNVLISGSTGLVGSELVPYFVTRGNTVTRLVRPQSRVITGTVVWDPEAGRLDPVALEGFDAVVHLAGENVAAGRWNAERKARIRDSRVNGTRLLCEALAKVARPPRVLVSASATGYYGSRGEEVLTEASPPGTGFLAEVCRDWEAATAPAAERGIRVVRLRIGVVLSPRGGALARMLLPFRLGLGGRLGDGRQYLSWVAIEDVTAVIGLVANAEGVSGPVNVVAPGPVTNYEFTKTLGRVLRRPTVMPMPVFGAHLAFGEMADELLLSSQRVEPQALRKAEYAFRFPELEGALRYQLGRTAA
jgi:uncharacterized protein (TIGR01777 family)